MRLPLFPLQSVLFPETVLPLHVFEPRYRELVGRCLEHDEAMGIVLIASGEEVGGHAIPRQVGVEAGIIASQRYPDGRYDLVVEGRRRFEIRGVDRSKPVLRAEIRFLDEVEDPEDDLLATAVAKLCGGLIETLETAGEAVIDETWKSLTPTALSYRVASILPTDLETRQDLLETPDTATRLRKEARILMDVTRVDATAGAT